LTHFHRLRAGAKSGYLAAAPAKHYSLLGGADPAKFLLEATVMPVHVS
jgi:hypothetical protein